LADCSRAERRCPDRRSRPARDCPLGRVVPVYRPHQHPPSPLPSSHTKLAHTQPPGNQRSANLGLSQRVTDARQELGVYSAGRGVRNGQKGSAEKGQNLGQNPGQSPFRQDTDLFRKNPAIGNCSAAGLPLSTCPSEGGLSSRPRLGADTSPPHSLDLLTQKARRFAGSRAPDSVGRRSR
jgi:hypothetical protein